MERKICDGSISTSMRVLCAIYRLSGILLHFTILRIKPMANFNLWLVYGFYGHGIIWARLRWLKYGLSIDIDAPILSVVRFLKAK